MIENFFDDRRRALRGRRLVLGLGLAALLTGCASLTAPQRFDLSPAFPHARAGGASLFVAPPQAVDPLGSDLVVVRGPDGALSRVPGVAWSNPLPELLLGKITASFENAGLAKLIAPAESATLVLRVEIRRFDIDAATRQAVVELTARLIANQGGAVVAAHVFSASAPVGEISGADPVVALDRALGEVLVKLVPWAASGGR